MSSRSGLQRLLAVGRAGPIFGLLDRGLPVPVASPGPSPRAVETVITADAGLNLDALLDLRAEPLVEAGSRVAQGQPMIRDRRRPHCVVTAPMAGRIAELEIGSGRRLGSLVIHHEPDVESHRYEVTRAAENGEDIAALRALLQDSGLWLHLRSRPFGRVPEPEARPSAIFVMAVDTRPLAADPRLALGGDAAEHFRRGVAALVRLAEGPVFLCQDRGPDIDAGEQPVRRVRVGALHPAGLAGLQIAELFPARPDRPVWDIAAQDVAAIGHLLLTGTLPATQLVAIGGPGLRESRLVRCQPGADLRQLCYAHMTPGQRTILSGSALDGREARWLGFRDRQVTVLERREQGPKRHWLRAALRRAGRPEPVIPTTTLQQALGAPMPGMALLRALSVGDDEAAVELGVLSLLEEDLALADYVTAASPRFADLLRAALNRIEAEL